MFRLLIRLGVFAVVIGLSLYIGVQWKLKEDLQYLETKLQPFVQFEYQSSVLTLNGTIILADVSLYFQQQDINISIDKIEYSGGSIFDMAFFRRQLDNRIMPEHMSLTINEAVIPLTPSLVNYVKSVEQDSTWNALNAMACGKIDHFGINQYFSMGYDYIVFSTGSEFNRDKYSGNLVGSGWLDVEETSRFSFDLNLAGFYQDMDVASNDRIAPTFERLTVDIQDKGYNHQRNSYCATRSGLDADEYVKQHVQMVSQKLDSVDIKMTLSGQRYYSEFRQPSSLLHLSIQPSVSFSFADFGYYDEPELRKLLGLKLEINHQTVTTLFNDWALDRFNQIVIRETSDETETGNQSRYKTVFIKREFQKQSVSSVRNFISQKIRVLRRDGKIFEGKLSEIKNNKLYIAMTRQGGIVEVAVEMGSVKEFSVYQ